jgi:hypothetical protein
MDSMTRDRRTEQRITDWLVGEGEYELPDRVLDQTFHRAAATRQLRALPGWRMFLMDRKFISFAAGAAAIAVVVIAGAAYFGQPDGSNVGGAPTSSAPPSPVTPGITGWKPYTSAAYGYTISLPSDWSVGATANHKWQPGEPLDDETSPFADVFVGGGDIGSEQIAMLVFQVPAPAGADVESWDGLYAAHQELCDEPTMAHCPPDYTQTRMCLGELDCAPAIIALNGDQTPAALIGDPEKGLITLFVMGRADNYQAAAQYGGTTTLLKSILSQLDVRDPQPGETPH